MHLVLSTRALKRLFQFFCIFCVIAITCCCTRQGEQRIKSSLDQIVFRKYVLFKSNNIGITTYLHKERKIFLLTANPEDTKN